MLTENRKAIAGTIWDIDLVAVRTGAPGTTAVIPEELAGSNCIDLVIVRRPRIGCERYLGWFLNSSAAHTQYELGAEGALQQHFNVEISKEVVVTSPPPTEQAEISKYIDQVITSHDAQVDKVRRSADLLLEYRSALIIAAVIRRQPLGFDKEFVHLHTKNGGSTLYQFIPLRVFMIAFNPRPIAAQTHARVRQSPSAGSPPRLRRPPTNRHPRLVLVRRHRRWARGRWRGRR